MTGDADGIVRDRLRGSVRCSPCGFHLDGAAQQARTIAPIFPNAAVWAIDGDGLVVRPGPRLVDGVEDPIVASRSEGAIARDLAEGLGQGSARSRNEISGQEALF